MKNRVKRWSSVAAGIAAGVALVVSCGDQTRQSGAEGDMSVGGSGGGACSGTCTVAGPITLQQPVAVTASDALPVSGSVAVTGAVAVSSVAAPVKVAGPVDVNVAGPVTVAGPVKAITADTDVHQIQGGAVYGASNTWLLLTKGPFVVTDLALQYTTSTAAPRIAIVAGADCTNASYSSYQLGFSGTAPMHGGRIVVPSGSVVCATTDGNTVIWSGYAPY